MTTYKRNKRDAKKAARDLKKGDVVWTVLDVAQNIAPYEDPHLLERHVVTGKCPITGTPLCGAVDVQLLVLRDGPVYTSRPGTWRALHEPTPQVSGPLGRNTNRRLDARELVALEEQVEQALADRHGRATARRKVKAASGDQKKLLKLVGR